MSASAMLWSMRDTRVWGAAWTPATRFLCGQNHLRRKPNIGREWAMKPPSVEPEDPRVRGLRPPEPQMRSKLSARLTPFWTWNSSRTRG